MERVGTRKLDVARLLAGFILFVSLCGCFALVFIGMTGTSVHKQVNISSYTNYKPWLPSHDPFDKIEIETHSVTEVVDTTIEWVFIGWAIAILILGIVSASCLARALDKFNYPLAIVGSMCATLAVLPLGLPLLILIIISRDEFKPVVLS
jgi:hypothetical protein